MRGNVTMPIKTKTNYKEKYVHAICTGKITLSDIQKYQLTVWEDPMVKGFNELFDARMADFSTLHFDDLPEIALRAAQIDTGAPPSKTAFLIGNERDEKLADYYQAQREFLPGRTRTSRSFYQYDTALNWLFGLPDNLR
jgi:hypothetical protein